jgi:phospholipase/carboxylesterase
MIRAEQARYGVAPADTVMGGFSQGAIMSLSLAVQHDGLAGRVLSFSGRFAALPDTAPKQTRIHFLHGELDPVIAVANARDAHARLQALGADATLDVEKDAGHTLTPALADRAIQLLRQHAVSHGA